ncbi:receptor-type tyrosine-protein phosphatase gamma [Tachysurus ichikawai]
MQIYMYNSDDFDSLNAAIREKRVIAAMAVFFQRFQTFLSSQPARGRKPSRPLKRQLRAKRNNRHR